jgi:hypothetical protein
MKVTLCQFVATCSVNSQTEHVCTPGLLQPLPVPTEAWQMICMDFIEGVLMSYTYNVILVVFDKFSKYIHNIPLCHPFIAFKVDQES